jgi:hypothetical protein
MSRDPRRASLPEVIGAWLRVWTPPRDVVVPPVPVRALAIGAVVAVLTIAAAAAAIVPAIDSSKERRAARDRAETAQRKEAERRRLIAEQRPRSVDASELRPPAAASAAQRVAAREDLLRRTEIAITVDARERAAAGELHGRPRTTECDPFPPRAEGERPEQGLRLRKGVYDCHVLLREFKATETTGAGSIGYPFRAVIDFRAFRVHWCKTNPVPGEQVIPDPRTVVLLPPQCRARG